jgi:serine/threonine protein kinase
VLNQYKMLNQFDHNNIVKALEYFVHKENQYITYEYHEKDLSNIIYNKSFTLDENYIRNIMKQILEGVNYLHEKNIIHRDIKPDNILISCEGIAKITDFDLAKLLENNNKHLTRAVVTIYYRPPEIFFGDSLYTLSVDMWSVGCILAEMILREAIFKGKNELDVVCKIFNILGAANVFYILFIF